MLMMSSVNNVFLPFLYVYSVLDLFTTSDLHTHVSV